jgi:hypothetical protein
MKNSMIRRFPTLYQAARKYQANNPPGEPAFGATI